MNTIRILALTSYGRLAASSRLRIMQFVEPLRERGITIDCASWLSDETLRRHYAGTGRRAIRDIVYPSFQRLRLMLGAGRYDAVWLQKEAFAYLPWFLEALSWLRLPPVVVDYDDAIFHKYDASGNPAVRILLGTKIDRVMAASACVMAGNAYLAARAKAAGAKQIAEVPTVLDPARYHAKRDFGTGRFRIGWIGTKSTVKYLSAIAAPLARAQRELDAELVIIGPDKADLAGLTPSFMPWSEDTEAEELAKLSLGIMPLVDSPWESGKCGYKIIQYMAAGLPAIASPVGANCEIIEPGRTGYLAATDAEWFEALRELRHNPARAASLGTAGRKRVLENYSLASALPKLEATFRAIVLDRKKGLDYLGEAAAHSS